MTIRQEKLLTILIVTLSIFQASCSFNKMFLQPDKAPVTAKRLTMATATDTTVIFFSGNNRQPTFTKNEKDTIDFGFTIESIIFKSKNGNNLNGWFLKPKDKKPTITLLHLHGNAGFLLSQYQTISPLLKNGFQVFIFDYSGFGFSEGEATRKNVLIDALSALDYIKDRQDVKETRLVIYGQSLGGHLAAVVGTQRQSDIDGLVIEGAFSSHKDIASSTIPVLGRILVKEIYSAKKSIKDFYKPLLVIHSAEDKEIPFYMGKKIFDNANTPKEFYEIKRCHICGPTFYSDSISQKIVNMLKVN